MWSGKAQSVIFRTVYMYPPTDVNLISTSQVTDQIPNLEIALRKGMCIIRDMSEMREDKVFRTRKAQCVVNDLKWKVYPAYRVPTIRHLRRISMRGS
jgi:hypothetical protein